MEKITQIQGLQINYKVTGQGENMVLLHGWGCDMHIFDHIHSFFEKKFTTYSIDLPGFGKSEEPPEQWGVEKYTVLVENLLKKLNINNPILLGHSFGGRIAILYASRNPVAKMILVDSAGVKPKRSLNYYVKVYTYKFLKKIVSLPFLKNYTNSLLGKYRKNAGSKDYQAASERMKQVLVKVVNEDLQHKMPKIKTSTLLIWGENDTATPVSDAKIMEQKIPDAGLVVLKNAGHYSFIDKMNEFLIITGNFLGI